MEVGKVTNKRGSPLASLHRHASISLRVFNEADWQDAYFACYPRVFRALRAVGASSQEAEDALQDACCDALRRRQPIAKVGGWLFVAANRAWRRKRFRDRLLRPFGLAASDNTSTDSRIDLLEALQRLPRRQREVLVARYVVGLDQEETARALGIARGTVAATTTKAARTLREALGKDYR